MAGDIVTLLRPGELSKSPLHDHHGSHAPLLDPVSPVAGPACEVDAVIVPAARPTKSLETAIRLAAELDAVCLVLCSKSSDPVDAVYRGKAIGADVVALQTAELSSVLPEFRTSRMLGDAGLGKNTDIALKRNLGLLLARMSSWKRIFFLDDDVVNVRADHVSAAAGRLHDYDAVGLWNAGFPDNSVVCHANRDAFPGGQDQFISTMALAFTVSTGSFFPNVYNEDWFFFLGDLPVGQWKPRLAATGVVRQKAYDPFCDLGRARREEFGDTIAEGLFWLLDKQQPLESADRQHWDSYLQLRRAFIERVIRRLLRVWRGDRTGLEMRLAALETALEQSRAFTPGFCADYVEAWRADLETWRGFIAAQSMPDEPTIAGALEILNLTTYAQTSR